MLSLPLISENLQKISKSKVNSCYFFLFLLKVSSNCLWISSSLYHCLYCYQIADCYQISSCYHTADCYQLLPGFWQVATIFLPDSVSSIFLPDSSRFLPDSTIFYQIADYYQISTRFYYTRRKFFFN